MRNHFLRAVAGNNGDEIVTSDLILHLDAGNLNSYPGSGTTWYDLSGSGNDGTLVNGVGYDSANNGSLTFDGSNDHISLGDLDVSTAFTISAWFKGNSTQPSNFAAVIMKGTNGILGNYALVGDSSSSWVRLGFTNTASTNITVFNSSYTDLKANTWVNYTGTYDFSVLKLYRNGVEIASLTESSTPSINNNTLSIGYRVDASVGAFSGRVSQALIYERALSGDEVQQNFDALKGRYGLS